MLAHMFMYADDNLLFTHGDVLEPNSDIQLDNLLLFIKYQTLWIIKAKTGSSLKFVGQIRSSFISEPKR